MNSLHKNYNKFIIYYRLVKCEGKCGYTKLNNFCGSAISDVAKNFTVLAYSAGKSVYDKGGMSWAWPEECNFSLNSFD